MPRAYQRGLTALRQKKPQASFAWPPFLSHVTWTGTTKSCQWKLKTICGCPLKNHLLAMKSADLWFGTLPETNSEFTLENWCLGDCYFPCGIRPVFTGELLLLGRISISLNKKTSPFLRQIVKFHGKKVLNFDVQDEQSKAAVVSSCHTPWPMQLLLPLLHLPPYAFAPCTSRSEHRATLAYPHESLLIYH